MSASNGTHDRAAILVLGMHRSGTSAVARILNIFGADLPRRMMPAASSNSEGHFEPLEIVNLHDEMLASVGSSWSDWNAFPEHWYQTADFNRYVDKLSEEVLVDFPDQTLAIVKDPRILRFIPVWLKVFERITVKPFAVLPFRDPFEVAASLSARNDFPMEHGYLLWLRHVLDAEFHTRGLGRTFVSYEQLLTRKTETLRNLFDTLPIARPSEADRIIDEAASTLDAKLRHNNSTDAKLGAKFDMPKQVRLAHEMHERLLIDPCDSMAITALDDIRDDFDNYTAISKAVFRSLHTPAPQKTSDRDRLFESATFAPVEQSGQVVAIEEKSSEYQAIVHGIGEKLLNLRILFGNSANQTQSAQSRIDGVDKELSGIIDQFRVLLAADKRRDEMLHRQQELIESLIGRLAECQVRQ